MPAAALLDLSTIDLSKTIITREEIYDHLPHRFEFMLLDGIVYVDVPNMVAVAFHEVREDDWWVRGHIPGRPLYPGVLMIETAAQMAAYFSHVINPTGKFLGFGGVENVKFRLAVTPPSRLYFVLQGLEVRPRRTVCDVQGFLNGQMAFEGRITGMPI